MKTNVIVFLVVLALIVGILGAFLYISFRAEKSLSSLNDKLENLNKKVLALNTELQILTDEQQKKEEEIKKLLEDQKALEKEKEEIRKKYENLENKIASMSPEEGLQETKRILQHEGIVYFSSTRTYEFSLAAFQRNLFFLKSYEIQTEELKKTQEINENLKKSLTLALNDIELYKVKEEVYKDKCYLYQETVGVLNETLKDVIKSKATKRFSLVSFLSGVIVGGGAILLAK